MLLQHFLYNQLSDQYLESGVTHACFVVTTDPIIGPRGTVLDFHTASRVMTYAAGRQFMRDLESRGISTRFIVAKNYRSGVETACREFGIQRVVQMDSSERYIRAKFDRIRELLGDSGITLTTFPNREFICSREDFLEKFPKPPLLEYFYRFMRAKTGLLMHEGKPEGSRWNYDSENRTFDRKHSAVSAWCPPESPERQEACDFYSYTGDTLFPISRTEALDSLEYFCAHHLRDFGRLEDAMYR
jgi:deoxyribodipyrimidine photolyase-related protein